MEQEKLDTLFKLLARALQRAEANNSKLPPDVALVREWMLENSPEYLANQ